MTKRASAPSNSCWALQLLLSNIPEGLPRNNKSIDAQMPAESSANPGSSLTLALLRRQVAEEKSGGVQITASRLHSTVGRGLGRSYRDIYSSGILGVYR